MNTNKLIFKNHLTYQAKYWLPILAIALFLFNLVIYHDSDLYSDPIVKIISIETTSDGTTPGDLELNESQYVQTLTCIFQNGTSRGQTILLQNTYTETQLDSTAYHSGTFLFLKNIHLDTKGNLTGKISDQKRDYFISILLSLVIFGAIAATGRRGFSFLLALFINIFFVVIGFYCYELGIPFILITGLLLIIFTVITLALCIGIGDEARIALLTTVICMSILALLYIVIMILTPGLDYTLQDYIRNGNIHLEIFFTCGTMIGCLGAIIDVSISIVSSVSEILTRTPNISPEKLHTSIRQIGLDVMGTMINVLFYTYMVGRIPICIAQLANGMPLSILFHYHLIYEILRFLAGAIGIVLCIPVSEKIATIYYRKKEVIK